MGDLHDMHYYQKPNHEAYHRANPRSVVLSYQDLWNVLEQAKECILDYAKGNFGPPTIPTKGLSVGAVGLRNKGVRVDFSADGSVQLTNVTEEER